jgi:UDP-glucuronate 4-epimerase
MRKVLVTGAAGFIGFHLAKRLLADGDTVVGIDNLNPYYDPSLKEARLAILRDQPRFTFRKLDITDRADMAELFATERFDVVAHLAAQAGVRYSLTHPHAYVESNVTGFLNVLEGCRQAGPRHLVYASTSSVYGANTNMPFSEHRGADHPLSIYAATKKANELMAHSYSHLFGMPVTALRFFTVYGPYGRPDMALFLFTKAMLEGRPIEVFNHGDMQRDFTYVDDVVEGFVRVLARPPLTNTLWSGAFPDPATSQAPFRIYNLGNQDPVKLLDMIGALERCLGISADKQMLPMQAGDVPATYADVSDLERDTGFRPRTRIEDGVARFVDWYVEYYGVRAARPSNA